MRLFLAVLDPVAYAHKHSVVHRDLKPGNILVGEDGRPRLLDFGIAKLLDSEGGEPETVTRMENRAFTPAYASPEQIRGEPVTAASDVHSLGVMLYELIAGVSPFRALSGSRAALESAVLTTDPAPPNVGGDLDAICLKALRKEPSARYSDAAALAEDLRRYLGGLPVEARRGWRRYQIGRFVRRRRELGIHDDRFRTGACDMRQHTFRRTPDLNDFHSRWKRQCCRIPGIVPGSHASFQRVGFNTFLS